MSHALRHIQFAVALVEQYDGAMPLSAYLKQYFAANKKFGSKDRRYITEACYSYYRLGNALRLLAPAERMTIALFLCSSQPYWQDVFTEQMLASNSLQQKLAYLHQAYTGFAVADLFSWQTWLSEGVESETFALSHVIQPDVFIRTRPGKKQVVLQKLQKAGIAFEIRQADCLAIQPGVRLEEVLVLQKEYVVQDASSQQVAVFMQLAAAPFTGKIMRVWDCCAASGGKSILATDVLGKLQLTVSDIRESILINLRKRFAQAGIQQYQAFVADLCKGILPPALHNQQFDLVICDAPCSGSGTWGRTPEQSAFFSVDKLNHYSSLQKQISVHAAKQVKPGGCLLYITCSVFEQENEAVVKHILGNTTLGLVKSHIIKGYDHKADSMFAALFKHQPSAD